MPTVISCPDTTVEDKLARWGREVSVSRRIRLLGLVAALGLCMAADLLACGDKFLVASRGTRYQRPKNARAASVLIYANPSSGLPAALGKVPVESVLKREGHRSTVVETFEQLSAVLAGGRFDVVLAASGVVTAIKDLLGAAPDAPVVVALCVRAGGAETAGRGETNPCVKSPPKSRSLLEAIDKAVERRDRNARRAQIG
jgi:hypothetical protein